MAEESDSAGNGGGNSSGLRSLVLTGLVALLGTLGSGVVKGYLDSRQAEDSFHSALILKALEPTDPEVRIKGLKFLVTTNLIHDQSIVDGVNKALAEGADSIPRFAPANAAPAESGVTSVGSVKAHLPAEVLASGAKLALVGLRVRHGDVVDGIGPLFAPIGADLELGPAVFGSVVGGGGGGETVLKQDGYIVTEIDVVYGTYFGREEIAQIQVTWQKLTPRGLDPRDQKVSELLGSGRFVTSEKTKRLAASPGNYITDFSPKVSTHTSGEGFLNDIEIAQSPLPSPTRTP